MRRFRQFKRLCALIPLCLLATSCNPPDDNGDSGNGGSDSENSAEEIIEKESHYPLIAGSRWEYSVVDINGVELRKEIVTASKDESVEDSDLTQIILEDNENSEGLRTRSKIRRIKSGAFRIHKDIMRGDEIEESVEYDPGFVRFDEAWLKLSIGAHKDYGYERESSSESKEEQRGHRYLLKAKKVKVRVPAGVFDTVHIIRERLTGASQGEKVEYWFAPGVGKVRELRPATGKEELLESYELGGN